MKFSITTFLAAILVSFSAFAQEVIDQATVIDFTNVAKAAVPFLMIIIGAVLLQLYRWLAKKIGFEKLVSDAELKKALDKIMDEGTAYAVSNIQDANWTKVETKHKALGFALNYVAEHGDELLAKTGLDTNKLQQKLEAKLLKYDTAPGQWTE